MNVGAVPWYPAAEASEKLPTSPSENTSRSYAGPSAASTLDSAKHGFIRHNPYQGTVLLSAADMDAVMSEDDRSPTSPCVEVRFRDGSHRSPPPPYRTHAAEAFLQQHHHLHATSSRKPVPEQMPVDPSDWEPYVSPSLRKPKGSYTAAVEAIATPRTSTEEHANVAVDGAAAPYRAAVATKLMAEESATKTSAEMVPLPRSRRVNATATSHEVRGPAAAAADAAKPHPSGASSTPTTTNGHHVAPASEPAQTVLAYTTKELGSPTTSGGLSSTFVRSVKGSSEGSDGGAASGGPTPVPRGRRPEEVPRAAAPSTRPARAKRGGNKSEDGWVIVGGRKGTSAAAAASLPAARTTNTLLQLVSAADKAAAKKKSATESSPRSSTTAKTLPPKNSARPVESEVARPTRAKAPETEEEATHARQRKAKEPATTRPARSSAKEVEELFEATLAESCAPSPSAAVEAAKVQSLALLSIPIASGQTLEEVVGLHTQPRSGQSTTQRGILQLVQRSLGLGESPNAKALLLQRAIQQLSDPFISKNPALCCVVLIEASDCFLDLERSLQCCHQALQIAEGHGLLLFEMLARLAITRALARVIDITNSREHLQRAAHLALQLQERAALGWVALQLGITLELSGNFSESLAWYAAAEKLAISTHQSRLQCDVLCCQGIAYYAVGEMEMAQSSHQRSLEVLQKLPRSWRQRPLQNFVQLKLQAGDMRGALDIHQEELLIAREQGDAMAISRCVGSIALTKKYLGWYEEAAEAYMEELATCSSPDARQAVESLTGAASCYLLSGHTHKALEYSTKAAHQALASNEHCTIAKALVELAAVELQRGCRDRANDNVMEALEAISRVDPTERQQYLVKATLCELEWRVSSILQRLAFSAAAEESSVEAASDKFFEALQYCDLCNVPNTVDVHRLLMRRLNMYLPTDGTSSFANASATPASLYLGHHLLSKSALLEVMSSDMMRHRKLVCYSLPWTEESLFLAFVVSLSDDGELVVRGHVLELSEEATCLLVNTNALNTCFDAPMATLGPLSDALAPRFYGDTPLWPQHYSKIAYDYEAKVAGSAAEGRLGHDAEYCLRVLYDALIRPLAADVAEDVALRGLTFVADGIFTRLPFHAFHDGERYLTQRLNVTTCSSLALLSMLYASHLKRVAEKPAADADADAGAKLSAHVVDISVHAETWEATSAVHVASASLPMEVAHTTIDANLATSIAPTEETSSTDVADDDDHITAHVSRLLRAMESQHKDRDASNCLFRAVHRARGGVAAAGAVLELNLPAQPEVREDYCGAFTTSDSLIKASYSLDAAITWDLHDYAMVVCSGCGTYSGLSIHETGVPVYRALQYAGAQRLLLPVGSRIAAVNADAPTSIATAAITACAHATSVAEAIRLARCAAIDAGLPLQTWAALTQCGLP